MRQENLATIRPYLSSVGPTLSFGGIQAFDKTEFESQLKTCRKYDCCIPGDFIKEYAFTHSFPPSMGQLEKVALDLGSTDPSLPLTFSMPIGLAGMVGQPAPSKEEGVILIANDHIWYGFLIFFAGRVKCNDVRNIKRCTDMLRRIHVTFHMCLFVA